MHNISIRSPGKILSRMIRKGNKEIMNKFKKLGCLETDMNGFNKAINFLRVLYVSDIMKGNAKNQYIMAKMISL